MKTNALIEKYSHKELSELYEEFNGFKGLSSKDIKEGKQERPTNRDSLLNILKRAFINPYSLVLGVLAVISLFIDIIFAKSKSYTSFIIISIMLLISGLIRLIEELKAKRATDSLNDILNSMVFCKRDGEWVAINQEDLALYDIIKLKSGDRAPADMRIIEANNLFTSSAILTGESEIVKKTAAASNDLSNMLFMGSTIISGEAIGICLALGNDCLFGDYKALKESKRGFDRGSNSIIWVLIKFMAILIPIVFVTAGLLKGSWLEAFLFSISVAVGLTPELLPMVITACLARGSSRMKDKSTVVKNINAMQAFGSMDVLCLDKTGTLTNDRLWLEYYMDIIGNESLRVLDLAYLNSLNSLTKDNHLDKAILECANMDNIKLHLKALAKEYRRLDERPFDYTRGIASVLLKSYNEVILIAKGGVDEILKRCSYVDYKGHIKKIDEADRGSAHLIADEMLEDGMKLLAIAYSKPKDIKNPLEEDLILVGFIAFFDAPKPSAREAIERLKGLNLDLKLLTGDNIRVSTSVCRRLNIVGGSITGEELARLSEDERIIAVEKNTIFAELTPRDKEEIVKLLKDNGHTVGFMGDGMNDLRATLKSDVGISVDTSPKALKDASDVILLKKDLNVIGDGISEGRRAFYNMSKYIKITTSSNLGNIIAIIIASFMLPFFPITSIELLLLNLLYDIICLALPWDNVNSEDLKGPLVWSGGTLSRFMLFFGPISSIFDVITFAFLFYYLAPLVAGGSFSSLALENQELFIRVFQTGWFLESMWSQVLIIHMLRTRGAPIRANRPSRVVLLVTILGVIILTMLVVTPVGSLIGFTSLPPIYYLFLIGIVFVYLLIVSGFKYLYVRKYKGLI